MERGDRRVTEYIDIPGCSHWQLTTSGKFDKIGCALADGHYSRRTPGSPQFMPPGQTIVLVSRDKQALWGWWRPHPSSGLKSMNGLDGWTCSIFRNTGGVLSSELVLDAERMLAWSGVDCGPSGMITYVWCKRVQSPNPGFCFQRAGWKKTGWSADRRKRLLQKPFSLAGKAQYK
jgi:hypothetical protein